jgi:hypothetical protein
MRCSIGALGSRRDSNIGAKNRRSRRKRRTGSRGLRGAVDCAGIE